MDMETGKTTKPETRKPRILISVISYNEEANIANTLKDLKENNFGYDVIVIDDGSNDNTARICSQYGVEVVSHCINSGSYSNTAMTYYLYAYRNNYDILCQFDGDGQHLATELPKIIGPVREGLCDCAIGSRFLLKEGFQSFFFRRIGIRLFSVIDSYILGKRITDCTSGFRAYNRRIIEFYGREFKQELHDNINQFLILTHYIGARIVEVPVVMQTRKFGKSSAFNIWNSLFFPLKGLAVILACFLQREQFTHFRDK